MKNEKQKTSVFGRSDQNDLKEWGGEREGEWPEKGGVG